MKNKMEKQKIILTITPDMGIYNCIVDNLKYLGFEVYLICNKGFRYKNFKDRLISLFRKIVFKDKLFKYNLRQKYNFDTNQIKLNDFPNVDFGLTIRADLFEIKTLENIKKKSKKNFCYHWDGLSRFENIEKTISIFDKFYIFDKEDLQNKLKTYPTTNFFFDCYPDLIKKNKKPEFDVYYIGSYDNRILKLIEICEFLDSQKLNLNIIICGKPKRALKKYKYIKFIKKPLTYIENLKMVSNSSIIIDLHHEKIHNGLSFRTFESLGFDKKLITSNDIVKDYDFYNPENIFVYKNNFTEMKKFISTDYKSIDSKIKYKYSFTNWINYILEIDTTLPILIP